jgi:1-acyl-sn-glycerol-3-phosphate acyltransferase
MHAMRHARALFFSAIFYPATLLFAVAGLIAGLVSRPAMGAVIQAWARFHHRLARGVLGVRTVVEGKIPPGPFLIAVKHQSMFETIEMLLLADTPIVVMKRQLTDLPFWGHTARRYGVIPVDREAGAKALRDMLAAAKMAATTGRPVLIYPEGTRVPPGTTPELRAGFSGLYRALAMPVVPVAHDSGQLFRRGLDRMAGVVTFRIGEVIPAGLKREEIEARVHAAINAHETSAS